MERGKNTEQAVGKTQTKRGKNMDPGGLKMTRTDPKHGPSSLKTRTELGKYTDKAAPKHGPSGEKTDQAA